MSIETQIKESVELAYLEADSGAIGDDGVLYDWKPVDKSGARAKSQPMGQAIAWDLGRHAIRTLDGKTYDVDVKVTAKVTELEPFWASEWDELFAS
jgi:hypothetical protein